MLRRLSLAYQLKRFKRKLKTFRWSKNIYKNIRVGIETRGWKNCFLLCLNENGAGASRESVKVLPSRLFARHDAVDLAKFRWQSLLLGELVFEECHRQLLVVLHRVQVELVESIVSAEFVGMQLQIV